MIIPALVLTTFQGCDGGTYKLSVLNPTDLEESEIEVFEDKEKAELVIKAIQTYIAIVLGKHLPVMRINN